MVDNLYLDYIHAPHILAATSNKCLVSKHQIQWYIPPPSVVLVSWSSTGQYTNCRTSGLRVTTPVPRGKKSRPTRASNTELFPELCRKKWNECEQKSSKWRHMSIKLFPKLQKEIKIGVNKYHHSDITWVQIKDTLNHQKLHCLLKSLQINNTEIVKCCYCWSFVRGFHRWPVDSSHIESVMWKVFDSPHKGPLMWKWRWANWAKKLQLLITQFFLIHCTKWPCVGWFYHSS